MRMASWMRLRSGARRTDPGRASPRRTRAGIGLGGFFELGDVLAGSGERFEELAIGMPPFDRGVSFGPFRLGQAASSFTQCSISLLAGGVRDHAVHVVVLRRVGVEHIEAVVGPHVDARRRRVL